MQSSSFSTRILHFVNSYSIWVALGSLFTFSFISVQYNGSIDWVVAIGFALGIWFIYTLDHLLDGMKLGNRALSLRHRLHFSQKSTILFLLAFIAIVELFLSLYLDAIYYSSIVVLVVFTGVHFIINHTFSERYKKKFFLKEVFIAFVVTVGFTIVPSIPSSVQYASILVFFLPIFLINLSNLLLFTLYDKPVDEATSTLSAASFLQEKQLISSVQLSLAGAAVSVAYFYFSGFINLVSTCLFMAMIASLFLLVLRREYFAEHDRYRFFGDFIYVYPVVILPFL